MIHFVHFAASPTVIEEPCGLKIVPPEAKGIIFFMSQLDGLAGRTTSLYLKPWPVCIFKD